MSPDLWVAVVIAIAIVAIAVVALVVAGVIAHGRHIDDADLPASFFGDHD